jgi:calcineurin-like phosphoesterase family protein
MKTYIASDLHFGHLNIFKFCAKTRAHYKNDGVEDVEYMNETMISEWNDIVEQKDTVYILGDVAFLPSLKAINIMKRLSGNKILIAGNHDKKILKDPVFRSCFQSIHDYLEVNYDGTKICMFHYPIAEWNQMHRGSVHFHGHLHGSVSGMEEYRCRDMGMDATGSIVITMEEAIASAMTGKIKGHH